MNVTEIDDDALADAYNLGLDLEKAGDIEGAEREYRKVLALDPSDPAGVGIRLAALGRVPTPEKMPDAYVATLFDQHADVFDDILVEQLGYCVPLLLREKIRQLGLGPFESLLDLGCGTGLTGVAFADCADQLTGVDLSEKIVEHAFDREVYDDLYVGEAVAFLQEFEEDDGTVPSYSFIAATDVFPYLGDAGAMVSGAAARLNPNGYFAFSTESLTASGEAGPSFVVGAKKRFAHRLDYLEQLLRTHGFKTLVADPITVRLEDGEPVPGHLVIAQLSAAA
ncbi:methyltransferase domain-containing protein [Roseibium sp. RKSG952]|nr:methyltransferase domain-containing protein [Roseibium sp. RKSG952]